MLKKYPLGIMPRLGRYYLFFAKLLGKNILLHFAYGYIDENNLNYG